MWKECEGNMRRNLMVLTISPLVFLLTLVQSDRAMAVVNREYRTETTTIANSLSSYRPSEGVRASLPLPMVQVTATVPAVNLVPPTLGPNATATPTGAAVLTTTAEVSPGPTLSITATLTASVPLTAVLIISNTEGPLDPAATETAGEGTDEAADAAYASPIEGTIIANRTEASVRFFVEGATYELDSLRSIGVDLPRVTAVLNLFNCDAALPETTEGCFWDPYLLDRDGFYEIIGSSDGSDVESLTLQPAGSPPVSQIWLQNRTGKRESVFYQDNEIELPPAAVREFAAPADGPAIFYLRSCLTLPDRTVCEWTPTDAESGFYYALEETTIAGSLPNSEIVALELRPVLSKDGEQIETPTQVNCQLQVPTLNVRSGPGLEYQIISKIRGSEQEPGRVTVVGRDELSEWLAVDARIADGGWITASPGFIQCTGNISSLPLSEISDGRLAPTPQPVATTSSPAAEPATTTDVNTGADNTGADNTGADNTGADNTGADNTGADNTGDTQEVPAEVTTAPEAAAPLSLAEGQALIIVNNGFDQQVRFTLDQRYRIEQGVSEYDLQPGEAISLLVYPGQLAFSASSPWRGLNGNSEFFIDSKETRTLWLTFVPDPDGSGRWILQY